MKKKWIVFVIILYSLKSYSQNIPVVTHIPSIAGDTTGIALLIHYPDSARYDTCGAPVAIVIAGGKGSTGIIVSYPAVISNYGFIEVFFDFPGGGVFPIESGGTYDLRGPNCVEALKDVVKFCSGEIADNDGKYLSELIPVIPNYDNVGLVGGSNGGNIAIVTAGKYGDQLQGLKWIANWETPVGDGNILTDMGAVHLGTGNPTHNIAYNDTTGIFDYSKLKYCDTLYFNYDVNFDTLAGFYFDNNNDGQPNDSTDFKLEPICFGIGLNERAFYSQKIIQLGYSMGIIPFPKPFYIPTFQEAKDFWKWRNSENWIDSVVLKRPDLLFTVTAKNHDHYINAPDHPGILFQYNNFISSGLNFVRLNPDKSYMEYVLDSVYPGLPDNPCFAPFDHLTIRNAMVPDSIDQKLLYAAAACELADRSIREDFRWQLDSVYGNCDKYIPQYSDSTDTDSGSVNDSSSTVSSVNNYSEINFSSQLFPNPSSINSNLIIHSLKDENVKIEVADLSGKIIYSATEKLIRGNNSVQINSTELDNGFYLLTIQNSIRFETMKLEVLH